jgi:hypothetical protein
MTDWSAELIRLERLRLLEQEKKEARARDVARQSSSSSSSSPSSRRGVKRTASSRESAACNSKSSSLSPSNNSGSSCTQRGFVRKEGYEYAFECGTCDYGNDRPGLTKRHQDNHAGVRYHCSKCTHQSTRMSDLQVHIRTIHEERKDFECPVCHKRFSQASNLNTENQCMRACVMSAP